MKKIAVMTSGGDSPGMNACVRAVVRTGIYHGLEVFGIMRGYEGMIDGEFKRMESVDVSNIIQRGGTVLKTARSQAFMTEEGRKKAYENLKKNGIEGFVAIGGDGTFRGATVFEKEFGISCVGVPGTIDNDLFGTDYTLGFDTAINTAIDAIDKIRDTAISHNRLFFVEVMGRDAGFIALSTGIAGGAEAIVIPETETDIENLIGILQKGWAHQKTSAIVIVAEGDERGGAFEIAKLVKEKFDHYDTRVSVLGHIQRGGNPTVRDRILGSRLGMAAVEALLDGKKNVMAGLVNDEVAFTPFANATKHHMEINKQMLQLVEILAL
ncbi:MAG: 6-phosphofructokinase [Bacteroidetes bacterium]|jgi:6-phosphofructokinase 1|nr:6-phosphofructokinase [Bacteroidota bacterium]MBP8917186.1 6-phosphofructokinase [Chitinophagales bacterium]